MFQDKFYRVFRSKKNKKYENHKTDGTLSQHTHHAYRACMLVHAVDVDRPATPTLVPIEKTVARVGSMHTHQLHRCSIAYVVVGASACVRRFGYCSVCAVVCVVSTSVVDATSLPSSSAIIKQLLNKCRVFVHKILIASCLHANPATRPHIHTNQINLPELASQYIVVDGSFLLLLSPSPPSSQMICL